MKKVCAWCQTAMESPGGDTDQVSHGICPPCFDNLMAKLLPENPTPNLVFSSSSANEPKYGK